MKDLSFTPPADTTPSSAKQFSQTVQEKCSTKDRKNTSVKQTHSELPKWQHTPITLQSGSNRIGLFQQVISDSLPFLIDSIGSLS